MLTVRDFGARLNGVDDDTQAFRDAVEHARRHGGAVVQPGGTRARVEGQIPVFSGLTFLCDDTNPEGVYRINQDYRAQIDTYADEVLVPGDGDGDYRVTFHGVNFQSRRPTAKGPCALFGPGVNLSQARIDRFSAFNYDVVFAGLIAGVSDVQRSTFHGTKQACFAGGVVDSFIHHNYIGGASGAGYNATGFVLNAASSHATIHHNFIEFLKYGVRFDFAAPRVDISHNMFDYLYRGISSHEPASGRGVALAQTIIGHNRFNRLSLRQFPSMSQFFPSPDRQMQDDPQAVAINAPYGVHTATLDSNHFYENDLAMRLRSYPFYGVHETGSAFYRMDDLAQRIDYAPIPAATDGKIKDVHIGVLDRRRVETLPNPTLTDSSGHVRSFDQNQLIHQGRPVYNDNGTWRDAVGVAVTA